MLLTIKHMQLSWISIDQNANECHLYSCHELRAEDLAQSFGAKLDLEWVKISGISHHQDDITLGTVSWF